MPPLLTISEILVRLEREYGPPVWHPRYDALSELVYTVLSQNTSDKNSQPAFRSLRQAFPRWEMLSQAPVSAIEAAIHSGGLARIKASRLKDILQKIQERQGNLELEFLRDMPVAEAKRWLMELPGVGPKTAACVLLFSLGRPVLPVDTHVYRVSWRLGLIGQQVNRERSHELLEALVPPEDIYRFHVLLIQHGRQVCKAQHPRFHLCVLSDGCPYHLAMHPQEKLQATVKG